MDTKTEKLKGKTAVITGGTSGIGLATAQRFVAEGAYVFITGRRKDALDAAVEQIGKNVIGVRGDVANLADLDGLYNEVKKQNRRIDILFANAGVAKLAPFGTIPEEFFDFHFNANVRGLFFTVQKAVPLLNGRLYYPDRLDRFDQRISRHERVQRHQGRRALVRAHLDQRAPRAPDSSECDQSRSYRYAHYGKFAAGGGARRDERRVQESSSAGQDGRSGRDRQSRRVPRFRRRELCLRHRALRRRWCRPNLSLRYSMSLAHKMPDDSKAVNSDREGNDKHG
jgi:NAD(P)-dependent dehydrogenase (short-subunit alcohol dehydrogenase family)